MGPRLRLLALRRRDPRRRDSNGYFESRGDSFKEYKCAPHQQEAIVVSRRNDARLRNWQDVIVNVFTTVGGGVVIPGAAAFLIRTALTYRLTQDAEVFKSKLKADSDSEIERLKTSLQMTALEDQVRFSQLHEKRAGGDCRVAYAFGGDLPTR